MAPLLTHRVTPAFPRQHALLALPLFSVLGLDDLARGGKTQYDIRNTFGSSDIGNLRGLGAVLVSRMHLRKPVLG